MKTEDTKQFKINMAQIFYKMNYVGKRYSEIKAGPEETDTRIKHIILFTQMMGELIQNILRCGGDCPPDIETAILSAMTVYANRKEILGEVSNEAVILPNPDIEAYFNSAFSPENPKS